MIERLKDVRSRLLTCRSPLWARDGHLQTLLGHLLPSEKFLVTSSTKPSSSIREIQERIRDPDAETVHIPLTSSSKGASTAGSETEIMVSTYVQGRRPMAVYLFHGLGGSSQASYMQRTAKLAHKLGYHVFMNNHRGCGDGIGLAVEPYHSGRGEDLSAVIAYGKARFPNFRHVAIGFSLSANALLLLVSGQRGEALPDAAIAINGPIQLDHASRKLSRGLNLIYNINFMLELRQNFAHRQKTGRLPDRFGRDFRLPAFTSLRDFDELYTAPAGGFKNRQAYYETCSAAPHLTKVQIPTVLLTSADDPFVAVEDYQSARLSDQVVLHIEAKGGHMGYLSREKTPLGTHRWLDYALREYLLALV